MGILNRIVFVPRAEYALAAPLMPPLMPLLLSRRLLTQQRGFALMLVLLLLVVGVGAGLFSFLNSNALTLENDQKTAAVLAHTKAALIGWAIQRGDIAGSPRPGEFPCADTNNDGFAEGTCVAGRLGRIPWKSLGIPEPKDSAGETLWYTVADRFRTTSNPPINSDTLGNIQVRAADGVMQLTTQAVAVIFAPGPALGAQSRHPATTALCPTTGTTIAQNLCAANYLDVGAGGTNNAVTNGPFIAGGLRDPNFPNYNDRVFFITAPQFMPAVEMRVAAELRKILELYYKLNGYFPFAAKHDDSTGNCALNLKRGRVPLSINDPLDPPTPPNVACSTLAEWTGSLPPWFKVNKWHNVMYYSVAPGYVSGGLNSCAGGCLTVGTNVSVRALFFMPGTPRGVARPSNNLADYLEDALNQDGWGALADDTYVTPTATALDRDRITTF